MNRYVRLIHWKQEEADERADRIRELGYEVDAQVLTPGTLRAIRAHLPLAVVIDLSRLPSHGLDAGLALRQSRATRLVPLIFVDGQPEKVAKVRSMLPDAIFTDWNGIGGALALPPPAEVVPAPSVMKSYADRPLPKKLGIQDSVRLVTPPEGFAIPGVAVSPKASVTLWFVRSKRELERLLPKMVPAAAKGGLWIAWPKRASGVETDVSQPLVREAALAAGLVDYKVAAIDDTWSGLKFTARK